MAARQPQEQDDFAAEPRSLDLRDYWSIVRRRWRLVVAAVAVGALAGAGYAVAKGPSYTATAQVVVQPLTQGPISQATQAVAPVNMSTEQAIAQSAPVIQQAAHTLGVPAAKLQTAVGTRLSVTVPASTLTTSNVLQINWQASSPRAAQRGANAFANAYLGYRHGELAGEIAGLEATLNGQDAALRTQIGNLSAQLSKTSAASTHRILTVRLNDLTTQESTYESQLGALATYNATGGTVIPAALPENPSGVGRSVIIAIGLVLGLLIGLVLAFVRDIFDDRVRDAAQFEQWLGAITLAVLPPSQAAGDRRRSRSAAKLQAPSAIAIAATPDSRAAEAVRTMRATVVAVSSRRHLRVLLVVAADTGMSSGRVVAELGVALAESGRRVLMIASDMRASALPQIFDVPDNAGLSELLIKGGDPEVLTRQARRASGAALPAEVAERLAVLPSGQRTINALSTLDSVQMLELLRGQARSHDFVLLDAPPATAADILSLASHVDGVIVLAREARTKGRDIEALRHRLRQVGTPIVGGVFIGRRRPRRHQRVSAQAVPAGSWPSAERSRAGSAAPVQAPQPGTVLPPVTRPLPAVPGDAARPSVSGGPLKKLR